MRYMASTSSKHGLPSPVKGARSWLALLLAAALLAVGAAIPSAAAQGTSDDADLAGLTLVRPSTLHSLLSDDATDRLMRQKAVQPPLAVSLNEAFSSETTAYTVSVRDHVRQVLVTPALSDSNATVTVNGGDPTEPVSLSAGENVIAVVVTAQDAVTTKTYTVTVTQTPYPLLRGDLTGLTVTDGNGNQVPMVPSASHVPHFALHRVPDFYSWISTYWLWVPSDVETVTVTPTWDAGSDYWIEVRAATDFEHPTRHNRLATTRVDASGQTSTAIPLASLAQRTEIWLGVHVDGGVHLYFLDVLRGTRLEVYCSQYTDTLRCPQEEETPSFYASESDDSETPPGPVQDLELTVKDNRIIATWNAPASGGAPSGYQVKLQDSDGQKVKKTKRTGANKFKAVYRNLERGETYQVSVRARNEWGNSDWTTSQITVE
ncbi:cadherin-like beta sandwich domain-containing protein [Candidatus Poriferisocius sp.]|uniref:cadherin-like beta sandwich domain-containing protein n=1 Tax=Candidatus Poriferisocius sp. TaxID=3101276 RepID=UPI003B0215E7